MPPVLAPTRRGETAVAVEPPAKTTRTRRAFRARVSSGHLVMLGAGALGVLLTLSVVRSADRTRPVLAAARDLVPGAVVTDADVRVARVHADAWVFATLFAGDDMTAVRGHVVASGIRSGQLLTRDVVRAVDAGAAARVMSFPLPRARAVGGKLASGDRVDVIAVEHDSWRAGYVLTDAAVVGVDMHDTGPLGGGSDDVTVSLIVDPEGAARLAAALDAGTVTLVRATGAPAVANPAPFVPTAKGS